MADGFNNRPSFGQQILDNAIGGNIGGIISTRPTAKYASGARCILKINGQIVGFAFGISWKISTSYVEINTVDDYMPHELAPQRISVDGTISALHVPGISAGTELWQSNVLTFLFHKYISIEVRDSQTDQLLFAAAKAVITSRQEDVKVDSLANVTLTWKAIGFLDERTPELPKDHNQTKSSSAANSSLPKGSTLGDFGNLPGFSNRGGNTV